ncbi:hypothetical protein PFISCL1PPCAC_10596, partial [Pristionchus fissidentatus]
DSKTPERSLGFDDLAVVEKDSFMADPSGKLKMDISESLPALPCALCTNDPSTLPPPPSLDKSTKGRLREHLIQFHSTLVATAFLHPNPSNNIHMWLMTCADYEMEEKNGDNESIEQVLTALLTSGTDYEQVRNTMDDGPMRSRKRKIEDEEEIEKKMKTEKEEEDEEIEPFDLDALLTKYRQLHGMEKEEEEKKKENEVDDKTCQMCWEESRYPGRHIAQKHLHKPLYECPVCEGFGSYEACTVVKHINKAHSDSEAQPVSNLEKYKDEILALQLTCFPNRPMKLVKTTENPRKRERHVCKVCKNQVAQSDRQRHVYHKHLCKERLFECPLCSFHSNYDIHRVKWHMKWIHKDEANGLEAISHEKDYRDEIDTLNEDCFPGWQHRKKGMGNEEEKEDEDDGDRINIEIREEGPIDISELFGRDPEETLNQWTCRMCLKEFKPSSNFFRHVAKEHLKIFLYECPLCDKGKAQDAYEIRAHLNKVHGESTLSPISRMEENAEMVQSLYETCFPGRKLKCLQFLNTNKLKKRDTPMRVDSPPSIEREEEEEEEEEQSDSPENRDARDDEKVTCQQCFMEMKSEDRQMHVYRHHLRETRLYECPLCEFAHHSSSSDVRNHIKYAHKDAEVQPRSNLLGLSEKIAEWNIQCFPGWINRRLPTTVVQDFNNCRLCGEEVRQTSRHIAESHLFIPLHQCPLCQYGAPESRLVKRHMRNIHHVDKSMEPIANVVTRRLEFSTLHDACFPGRPKRLSTIVISEEGRRTKCRLCGGVYARKRRMSHVLQSHLNKKVFRCSLCSFSSNHDEEAVAIHVKDVHDGNAATINQMKQLKSSISSMARQCFPDWIELNEELK